jgi:hypothetical protein
VSYAGYVVVRIEISITIGVEQPDALGPDRVKRFVVK